MSCRSTSTHAGGECSCFKPEDFLDLLENQQIWLQLLLCMTRERWEHPESAADVLIKVMLGDRTRWLRN